MYGSGPAPVGTGGLFYSHQIKYNRKLDSKKRTGNFWHLPLRLLHYSYFICSSVLLFIFFLEFPSILHHKFPLLLPQPYIL